MIRRDYVLKQLEEFGKVVARLFSLREKDERELLQEEIAEAVQKFTHLEISLVESMEADAFTVLALGLEDTRLKMLADLLYEKLHYYILSQQPAMCTKLKYRCIKLYELVKARNPGNFDMSVYYKVQFLETV